MSVLLDGWVDEFNVQWPKRNWSHWTQAQPWSWPIAFDGEHKAGLRLPTLRSTLNTFESTIRNYYGIIHWNRSINEHHFALVQFNSLLLAGDVFWYSAQFNSLCVYVLRLCIRNCYERSSGEIRSCAARPAQILQKLTHFRLHCTINQNPEPLNGKLREERTQLEKTESPKDAAKIWKLW